MKSSAEQQRLLEYRTRQSNWKNWGPYLSERAWGTVREDYSEDGSAWDSFPHEHARSRTYRWNEDGLAGISDRFQYLCFALALWNGRDPFLKERMFGLTGSEGNHGEDVKEYYFYEDSTPTHSYMKMLYKYPHAAFPYEDLVHTNQNRTYDEMEYELLDTGVFEENRYFDVRVEYAKAAENDLLIKLSVTNRGPEAAECHLLPTLWFRNTWSWGYDAGPMGDVPGKPIMRSTAAPAGIAAIRTEHSAQGVYHFYAAEAESLYFTENETNIGKLYGVPNPPQYTKDAFHRHVVNGEAEAINPKQEGTKAAAHYQWRIEPGETRTVKLRLSQKQHELPFEQFGQTFEQRIQEADEFYAAIQNPNLSTDEKHVQRQAFAGMLWSKQMFYYDVEQWLKGDPGTPPPPEGRKYGRNVGWEHLNNFDIISMPDKWEYPWYAGWDLAFHCLPLVMIDADFAKRQLELLTREWYMHPNGQFPAYEWAFEDVNPPVHAWATWRVYKIDARQNGKPDLDFLKGIFNKLLLNFTWWVNRKDVDGNNIFQGGFLGLDNISLFDRSAVLPTGGHIDQSDGTAWMGFYSLGMMTIALELSRHDAVYQDMATKFYEHFLRIATAMSGGVDRTHRLWDDEDGFFYDVLHLPNEGAVPLKVRSLVGLMPLLAVETLEPELLEAMPLFKRRLHWFTEQRPELSGNMASVDVPGEGSRHIVSIITRERLEGILRYMLDENEFLSPFGIRSVSRVHEEHPYSIQLNGSSFSVEYQPAESRSWLFGGNSNWRGPIWMPINFLLIESLQKFHHYYGDSFKVEFPTGSGHKATLGEIARELSRRINRLFLRDENNERPIYGGMDTFQHDPHWRDLVLFNEYFHGDNGAGLGATHQTGWTGLVAKLIQQSGGGVYPPIKREKTEVSHV